MRRASLALIAVSVVGLAGCAVSAAPPASTRAAAATGAGPTPIAALAPTSTPSSVATKPSPVPTPGPSRAMIASRGPEPTFAPPGRGDVFDYRGSAARPGVFPGPGPSGKPGIAWTFLAGGPIAAQVAVKGRTVYLEVQSGNVVALDLVTGKPRWAVTLKVEAHSSPALVGGLVIVGAEDGVHAYRQADGSQAWWAQATGIVGGAPAVVANRLIVANDTGTATALDVGTGSTVWTAPLPAGATTSLATDGSTVVLGTLDGNLVALNAADGARRWIEDTGDGSRIGSPAIADGVVYAPTLDDNGPGTHHVFAYDLASGTQIWRVASPQDVPAYTPAVADGLAFVDSEAHLVVALDAKTGAPRWQTDVDGVDEIVASYADGVVYTATNDGSAYALDARTGGIRWRVPINGTPYGMAVTHGLAIVGTDAGILYAIGTVQP